MSQTNLQQLTEVIKDKSQFVDTLFEEVGKVVVGQTTLVEKLVLALLCDGHVLLEGLPGLAKTLTVKTLAQTIDARFNRLQFTPDLLPSDLIGTMIFNQVTHEFTPKKGPIFTNIVLADEINRAPAKVQSALLEAMGEHQVTIGETTYPLDDPFIVLATQNPIEQEGTYPLPEAQLDRFLMQIDVGYPDAPAERRMLIETTGAAEAQAETVMTAAELLAAQDLVRRIPVGDGVVDAILALVRAGRPESSELALVKRAVAWGPGPRAAQALMLAVRGRALIQGRLSPSLDDVAALAPPVLRHRMALGFAARADGVTMDAVVTALIGTIG